MSDDIPNSELARGSYIPPHNQVPPPPPPQEPYLLQNAVYCIEDDVYLVSSHVHDFRTHVFKDSKSISVDGGLDYCRRAGDFDSLDDEGRYRECCLRSDQPFDHIAQNLLWGTRGRDGKESLRYRPIKEFTPEHLDAIILNCPQRSEYVDRVVRYWLAEKTRVVSE